MPKPIGSITRHLTTLALCAGLANSWPTLANAKLLPKSVNEVEASTDRWIGLESQIASAKTDWLAEKTLLENTVELLKAEEAALAAQLEANKKASGIYLGNRDRMRERVAQTRAALEGFAEPLNLIEKRLDSLLPGFPEPLQEKLQIHLNAAEAGAQDALAVPARVQAMVAALTAIDRFGNTLTTDRVARPAPDSGEVSVQVLYWGLACGFAIDPAHSRAWIIEPKPDGWSWQAKDVQYQQIALLFEQFNDDTVAPALIELPLALR